MDASRRKQLRDGYKSKPAVGAVYAITCTGNGRRYVRATVDIEGIRNRFNFALKIHSAPDPTLQNEWRQYGSEAFALEVLEELTQKEGQTAAEFSEDIETLLQLWQEKEAEEAGA